MDVRNIPADRFPSPRQNNYSPDPVGNNRENAEEEVRRSCDKDCADEDQEYYGEELHEGPDAVSEVPSENLMVSGAAIAEGDHS